MDPEWFSPDPDPTFYVVPDPELPCKPVLGIRVWLKIICLRVSCKKKKNNYFCSLKVTEERKKRKELDPELVPDPELDLDPDPLVIGADPDPHQNVTDPQRFFKPGN